MVWRNEMTMTPKRPRVPRKRPAAEAGGPVWGKEDVLEAYPVIQMIIFGRLGWQRGEDVVQEALEAILEGIGGVTARTKSQFYSWCYTIARNKVYNAMRSKSRNRIDPYDQAEFLKILEAEAGVAAGSMGVKSDLAYLLALLRASKFPCDEILLLQFVFDLEDEEIGAVYGISKDAARMKARRCLDDAKLLAKKHL